MKNNNKVSPAIENRKEIPWTNNQYAVSDLWRAKWPRWILNEKINDEWKKRIKNVLGYPQMSISYEDKNWKITRKDKLVHTIIAELFGNMIEDHNIKETFTHPRITHKNWNREDNNIKNLRWINRNGTENLQEPPKDFGVIKYKAQEWKVTEFLLKNYESQHIAEMVFKEKYTPKDRNAINQFIYREKIKLKNSIRVWSKVELIKDEKKEIRTMGNLYNSEQKIIGENTPLRKSILWKKEWDEIVLESWNTKNVIKIGKVKNDGL